MVRRTTTGKRSMLRKAGMLLLGLIAIAFTGVAIALNTIVSPKRITPIVLKQVKRHMNANVECEYIDITFFSTFPYLGIALKQGLIASEKDTLLAFEDFTIAVNPIAFLSEEKIIIKRLILENAEIYAFVDTTGRANWDIFNSADREENGNDTIPAVLPELNISNIQLRNVNFTYDNLRENMLIMADSIHMRLKGNLSKTRADIKLGMSTSGLTTMIRGEMLTKRLPIRFDSELGRDRVKKTFTIEKGKLQLGNLELKTEGMLSRKDTIGIAEIDLDFALNASSPDELMGMFPAYSSLLSKKLTANGNISATGKISGILGHGNYPVVTANVQLTDGSLAPRKEPERPFLQDLDIDIEGMLDMSGKQPSYIYVNNLSVKTANSKISASGACHDLLVNPYIETKVKADINFTQMSKKLPLPGIKMEGIIDADLTVKCLVNDLLNANYGKINANGRIGIDEVTIDYPEKALTFYTSKAEMQFGSNKEDTIRGKRHESLLRGKISLDTLNLNYQQGIQAEAIRLSVIIDTSAPKDTASVAPVLIGGRAKKMRLVMGDSIKMHAISMTAAMRTSPRNDMPQLPEISATLMIDSMIGRVYEMVGRMNKAEMKLKLSKQHTRSMDNDSMRTSLPQDERRRAWRDTTLTRMQLDSIRRHSLDPATNIPFRVESKDTRNLLRQWDVSGRLSVKDASVRTPYFQLPIRLRESEIILSPGLLTVEKTHLRLGDSDFKVSGEIKGIKEALLLNRAISTKMELRADSVDFNEIIRAAVAGSEYAQKTHLEKDSIAGIILDMDQELSGNNDSTQLSVFVVPRNLDLEFNIRVKQAKLGSVLIKRSNGRIILRDQTLQITNLHLNTNIGSATTTMVYKAPDTKGAHLGMELEVAHIDIKELIAAMPFIDEMAPMLRSFEGVVNCNITALTELDSLMNVRLPETTASCYLTGKNLVLLDGETFAEISKTLMFKNKNKNRIDSISVEMILDNEKLMIFPFLIAIDRYNAAVGGIQNLDMSFDYHITVLKSPVPFKLGLNISGNPDKMKIRLGKAKYKDLFTVTKEKKLTNTINLRVEMDEKLKKAIQEITGMEVSKPVRRPRTNIPDSLRRALFQLEDTTTTSLIDSTAIKELPDTTSKR